MSDAPDDGRSPRNARGMEHRPQRGDALWLRGTFTQRLVSTLYRLFPHARRSDCRPPRGTGRCQQSAERKGPGAAGRVQQTRHSGLDVRRSGELDAARTATGSGSIVRPLDATGAGAAAAAAITTRVAATTAAGEAAAAVESGSDDQTEGENEELLHGGIPSQRWVRFHPVDGSPGDGGDGREGRRRDTTSLKTQQARLRKLE